jgi:hypothetical protein
MKARGELQNAADAAALAAAKELTGAAACADRARTWAGDFAGRHDSDATPIALSNGDVSLGRAVGSDATGWTFQAAADETRCGEINAVRVVAARGAGAANAAVLVFFAGILNSARTQDIGASAVAQVLGPATAHVLPFPVEPGALMDGDGNLRCGEQIELDHTLRDLWGLSSLDPHDPANANRAADIVNAGGMDVDVGAQVRVQQGNDFVNNHMEDALAAFCHLPSTPGHLSGPCTDAVGQPPLVYLPVVDDMDAHVPMVVGFTEVAFVGVDLDHQAHFTVVPSCRELDASTPAGGQPFGLVVRARLIE